MSQLNCSVYFIVNAEEAAKDISTLSKQWQSYTEHELSWTIDVIEEILKTDLAGSSREVIQDTLDTINNMLFISEDLIETSETEYDSSSR